MTGQRQVSCGRAISLVGVLIFSFGMTSCGTKNPEGSTTGVSLSGKVTHNGKAIPGTIALESETNGKTVQAVLGNDGTYTIASAPAGNVKVKVSFSPRHLAKDSERKELPSPAESSRTLPAIELHDGRNEFSIDLP